MNDLYISKWHNEGLINQDQAAKMAADLKEIKKTEGQSRFITAISIIGSILLGLAAILFISANWSVLSDISKVLILMGSTLGTLFLGFLFKYEKQNLPKVGMSLIFLSALLMGASIFLISQIYNVEADSHWLILLWLIAMIPLMYADKSAPITAAVIALFYAWFALYMDRGSFHHSRENESFIIIIYLLVSMLTYEIGTAHYIKLSLHHLGRIISIVSLMVSMTMLYALSFEGISNLSRYPTIDYGYGYINPSPTPNATALFLVIIIFMVPFLILNTKYQVIKSIEEITGRLISASLIVVSYLFFTFPSVGFLYTIVFNLIFSAVCILLLYFGYKREDTRLINMGMFWTGLFIITKYFVLFYDYLPTSLFFLIGGIIFIGGGIFMEKKRRNIIVSFTSKNAAT